MDIHISKIHASRWSLEKASTWADRCAEVRGCNYIPMNCVNSTAFWQSLDEKLIDRELGWAEDIGLNSLRIFIQYMVYESNPQAMIDNVSRFLDLAAHHQMTVMPVLFDDCWGPDPSLGKQPDPIPGVHNSRWTASPGFSRVKPESWPALDKYVHNLINRFAEDERIIAWDLYNEAKKENRPLVKAAFSWARDVKPSQPLVSCWEADDLQDVITFHCYADPEGEEFRKVITTALESSRPVICTECMARPLGSTLDKLIPVFTRHRIGWYIWGLVAGATQTRFPWGWPPGGPEPYLWFHDLLYPDGKPYSDQEVALIRQLAGKS